jgi:hypothetical protein
MEDTRPVSREYRDCALLMSVVEAPGKFAVVNIPAAGSPVVTPRLMLGTLR